MNAQILAALFQEKARLMKEVEKLDAAMEALGGESSAVLSSLARSKKSDKRHRKLTKKQVAAMVEGRRRAKLLREGKSGRGGARNFSAEGKARIAAAAREMWVRRRADKAAKALHESTVNPPVDEQAEVKPGVTFAEL